MTAHIKIAKSSLPWIIPAFFILVWLVITHTHIIPAYLLPHPFEIIHTGYLYIFGEPGLAPYAGRFFSDALASMSRVFLGFSLAALVGFPLGIISGRVSLVHSMFNSFINALRAVPGITWLPLALVWFGIGMKTTVFLVALAAFFPIYLNTLSGSRQIDPHLLRAGAMMGVGRIRGTFNILIPGCMPSIMTGLRLGLGISWAYLVLGELTGVPNGLGAVIMDARMLGRIDMIIVGMLLIAIVGRTTDVMLVATLKASLKSARRMA